MIRRHRTLQRNLLRWFARHRRDLPWRNDRDPYRILVSEAMLQQTQVVTVVRYFDRFLEAFPDPKSLAAADEQEVLRVWQGLGYYRRARHLHQAARMLVSHHNGQVPADPDALAQLPGVGRYTVGAVLSQAFDLRWPIVEANTKRVLCRLFAYRDDPSDATGQAWLWAKAEEILPDREVGDFNQAMMELGALVCTPAEPKCGKCPLASVCEARKEGLQEAIPPRNQMAGTTALREAAIAVQRRGRFLLAQRPATGRWAGMWEFPRTPVSDPSDRRALDVAFRRETALRIANLQHLGTVRQTVTRYRMEVDCFTADHKSGDFASERYSTCRWTRPNEWERYPAGTVQRRMALLVVKG